MSGINRRLSELENRIVASDGDGILDADQKCEALKAATVTQNTGRKTLLTELRRQRDILKAHGVPEDKYAALGFPTGGPSGESVSTVTVPAATVDTI